MAESRGPRSRLDTPQTSRRQLVRRPTYDPDLVGSFAEKFARFMGTATFLAYMTLFVAVWVGWNALAPEDLRWDDYPFIFLTLMLSLQASYAAPLILLAQNRQEDRDQVIAEQDRQANTRAHADMEFLAREVASLRMAVGEVATRDFLRSELRSLRTERDERAQSHHREVGAEEGSSNPCHLDSRIMSTPTLEQVNAALATVNDPEIKRPITDLGMVDSVVIDESGLVHVKVLLTVAGCPLKDTITRDVTGAVESIDGVTGVDLELGVMTDRAARRAQGHAQQRQGPAGDPVRPARLAHQGVRDRQRQGRCRQVVGDRQPGARDGQAGHEGRHRRRRHLRPLGAGDARHRRLPAHPGRRPDHAGADRRAASR